MFLAICALAVGIVLTVMNAAGININVNIICSLGVLVVGFMMLIKGADLFVEARPR